MMDDDDDEGGSEATPAGAEPFSLALAKHAECLATVEPSRKVDKILRCALPFRVGGAFFDGNAWFVNQSHFEA